MSSLNASLATALSGLTADQGAMQATTNNVANVNTPGYSRQEAVLVASDPVVLQPLTFGTGVTAECRKHSRPAPRIANPATDSGAGPVQHADLRPTAGSGQLHQQHARHRDGDFQFL
jgi:flagellar basal body rod protein FlgG